MPNVEITNLPALPSDATERTLHAQAKPDGLTSFRDYHVTEQMLKGIIAGEGTEGEVLTVNSSGLAVPSRNRGTGFVPVNRSVTLTWLGDSFLSDGVSASSTLIVKPSDGVPAWVEMLEPAIVSDSWIDGSNAFGLGHSGANLAKGGDNAAEILARADAALDTKPDILIFDGGYNDIGEGVLTAAQVVASLSQIIAKAVSKGTPCIYMGVWVPTLDVWAAGSDERYMIEAINNAMRNLCDSTPGCYFFDTNQYWANNAAAALSNEPKAGYVKSVNDFGFDDGVHPTPVGAHAVAEGLLSVIRGIVNLPNIDWLGGPGNIYHATKNPGGIIVNATPANGNPYMTGTVSASGTGFPTGERATNFSRFRRSGNGECTMTKNADGSQRLTFTSPTGTEAKWEFRWDRFVHGLPAGMWFWSVCPIRMSPWDAWVNADLINGEYNVSRSAAMTKYDDNGSALESWPSVAMNLYLKAPKLKTTNPAREIECTLSVRIREGKSGTGFIDIPHMGTVIVPDPMPRLGF